MPDRTSTSDRPGPPAKPELTAAEKRGRIRNAFESIGMAVLMAVLLKYFALEAYVIPTPSMQPTLMGSPEAGESDRILVDKVYYDLHEPERWDIAVFRYPVRQVQSYVKRIVGVGGDRIKIAGGNLYDVSAGGRTLEILRKPARIQGTLWREIYPMRRKLELLEKGKDPDQDVTNDDVLGPYFRGRGGKWNVEADGTITGKPNNRKTLQLSYTSSGSRNNYSDGYDLDLAKALREGRQDAGTLAVQDLALDFELTPSGRPQSVDIVIDVFALGISFGLEIKKGQAKLVATRKTPAAKEESALFPFEVASGATTHIRFERLDDRLIAYRDGDEVARLDTNDVRVLQDVEIGKIVPRITILGSGTCRFAEMRVERDLHYTHGPPGKNAIIEVPEGHFFMMGDNTLGSADGRHWTAIEIGVDKDGNIVDPKSERAVRRLWGNKRPKAFDSPEPPHDDDNPVPMRNRDRVVFVDDMGEIHALKGRVNRPRWASRPKGKPDGLIEFMGVGGAETFKPPERPARFVPRKHIQGRPIARFLRSVSHFKFTGWIR